MIAEAVTVCVSDPTTAQVVQQTVIVFGGMGLAAFVLYGFYKLIRWGGE